jgi:hypothetical protein
MNLQKGFGAFVVCVVIGVSISAADCFASTGNRSQPAVLAEDNQLDSSTHLQSYNYAVQNPLGNSAVIDTLVIKLEPGVDVVSDIKAPPGWRAFYSSEQGTIMWAATGFRDPEADDATGNISPSDYAIPVGATLTGFSFKSFSPPGAGLAITQSFAPLYVPATEDDFESMETDRTLSTLPEDNGYSVATVVPVPDADWTGNRRPAVDGFLVFANVQDKTTFKGSALIVVRLGGAGESVDATTLQILLNGSDVTKMFGWSKEYNGYAATFEPGVSPIQIGSNVLRTSVQGIVPGTTDRLAFDTDRLSFDFAP